MNCDRAIIIAHCPDQIGIIAAVTDFLLKNNGNIIRLDQHVDNDIQHFFVRVEWDLGNFDIPRDKIGEFFETLIAQKFGMTWSLSCEEKKPRIALFVSKYGHCLFDILSKFESKEWDVDIPLIVSNHEKFRFVADRMDIPFYHLKVTKENKKETEAKQIQLMRDYDIDLIVLARYMQILTGHFVDTFKEKIINIHHSSLPAFAGSNPYKSAYERGVKFMGATAHYVTEELDAGPIIIQDVVNISHREGLADMKRKGRDIEKIVLSDAIWAHINHKVLVYKNKTVVF